jgi:hypothetical protein
MLVSTTEKGRVWAETIGALKAVKATMNEGRLRIGGEKGNYAGSGNDEERN